MKLFVTVLAIGALPLARGLSFSYDTDSPDGPASWADLEIEGVTNECGGKKQSGVDIPVAECGDYDDYSLSVSKICCSMKAMVLIMKSYLTLSLARTSTLGRIVHPR
jgi:hypothetical protein